MLDQMTILLACFHSSKLFQPIMWYHLVMMAKEEVFILIFSKIIQKSKKKILIFNLTWL